MCNEPKWPQCSEHSQNLNCIDLNICEGHIEYGGGDDEEIHLIPLVPEVRTFVHSQAEGNQLDTHFQDESIVEEKIRMSCNSIYWRVFFPLPSIKGELETTEANKDEDNCLPVLMLDEFVAVDSEAITLTENEECLLAVHSSVQLYLL